MSKVILESDLASTNQCFNTPGSPRSKKKASEMSDNPKANQILSYTSFTLTSGRLSFALRKEKKIGLLSLQTSKDWFWGTAELCSNVKVQTQKKGWESSGPSTSTSCMFPSGPGLLRCCLLKNKVTVSCSPQHPHYRPILIAKRLKGSGDSPQHPHYRPILVAKRLKGSGDSGRLH
jgi:hypothetical protein